MSSIPQDLLYTKDHEYVKKTADASVVIVGITDYAQGELGDIVFLDLPATGKKVGEWVDDTKERVSDKVDELQADAEVKRAEAEVKKAEAERDAVEAKNEYKEQLRD